MDLVFMWLRVIGAMNNFLINRDVSLLEFDATGSIGRHRQTGSGCHRIDFQTRDILCLWPIRGFFKFELSSDVLVGHWVARLRFFQGDVR